MRIINKALLITLAATALIAVSASGVCATPQHGQVTWGPWNSAQYGVIIFSGNNPMDLGVNSWNASYIANMVPENFSFAQYIGNAPDMTLSYDNDTNVSLSFPTFANVTSGLTGYVIPEPYDQIINGYSPPYSVSV